VVKSDKVTKCVAARGHVQMSTRTTPVILKFGIRRKTGF
jgi:hypothetical protein